MILCQGGRLYCKGIRLGLGRFLDRLLILHRLGGTSHLRLPHILTVLSGSLGPKWLKTGAEMTRCRNVLFPGTGSLDSKKSRDPVPDLDTPSLQVRYRILRQSYEDCLGVREFIEYTLVLYSCDYMRQLHVWGYEISWCEKYKAVYVFLLLINKNNLGISPFIRTVKTYEFVSYVLDLLCGKTNEWKMS